MIDLRTSSGCKNFLPVIMLIHALLSVSTFALEMRYLQVLPSVVTDASIRQFDLFGTGLGTLMFTIHLDNTGDTSTYKDLQIRYLVLFTGTGGNGAAVIYEGKSNTFSMGPGESVFIPSTGFLKNNNPAVRASLAYTVREFDDVALKEKILSSQRLPDGEIVFELELLQRGVPFGSQRISDAHTVLNSTEITLVTPGNPLGQPPLDLRNPRPLFVWTSQLYPGIYGDENVFELRIYEARPGITASEALARPPVYTSKVNAMQVQFPADGRQLLPGYTYYWDVHATIKGAASTVIRSEVYWFRLAAATNPKVLEILAILQMILDQPVIDRVDGFTADARARINGETVTAARLREEVMRIQSGDFSLVNVDVR